MKKIEFSRVKIIYSTIAAVIFVVLLVLFFPGDREYQRIPYDVVFLGDSVYGLCRDETSIAAKLQEKTGLKCYNGGLGGTENRLLPSFVRTDACSVTRLRWRLLSTVIFL